MTVSCVFQLEKSLKVQIDAWEQEQDKEFLVNGQKFLEYVQEQWDYHHTEKEKEKMERVSESFVLFLSLICPHVVTPVTFILISN